MSTSACVPAHERRFPPDAGRPTLADEAGGAFGALGTLLPILLGATAVGGLAPGGVLVGFGLALVATGLFYRLPLVLDRTSGSGATGTPTWRAATARSARASASATSRW